MSHGRGKKKKKKIYIYIYIYTHTHTHTQLLIHHKGVPSHYDVHTNPVYGVLTMETEAVVVVTKYFLTARFHVIIKKQNLGNDGFFL